MLAAPGKVLLQEKIGLPALQAVGNRLYSSFTVMVYFN